MTDWNKNLSKLHQTRRRSRTQAVRTVFKDRSFASRGEAEMAGLILMMQKAKEIRDIRYQVKIPLTPGCRFTIDFVVFHIARNIDIGIEFKGREFERWLVIKQLWPDLGPMPMQVWVKKGDRLKMDQEIQGKR